MGEEQGMQGVMGEESVRGDGVRKREGCEG